MQPGVLIQKFVQGSTRSFSFPYRVSWKPRVATGGVYSQVDWASPFPSKNGELFATVVHDADGAAEEADEMVEDCSVLELGGPVEEGAIDGSMLELEEGALEVVEDSVEDDDGVEEVDERMLELGEDTKVVEDDLYEDGLWVDVL